MSDKNFCPRCVRLTSRLARSKISTPNSCSTSFMDGYGWRVHPIDGNKDNHRGVDIAVATGTEILAAHDGTVSFVGNNGSYGLVVFLEGE